MKKTIKVNLGGIVFQLDEDAYDLLREYLDRLEARFSQLAGGNEILNDIEVRMAELFSLRLTSEREVVNLTDAREVTAIMGDPAEIGDGEEEPEVESTTTHSGSYRRRRRFYRDPDNQVIGGVCSGLGAYFNLDPVIIRVLFVMFTLAYGTGLLVYLILWIGMPEARTSAEKLEMHGEEINVLNIERRVRQDYDDREFLQSGSEGRSGRGRGAG
ncbi:MAG: PspC domain-containing protein, partial [Bacteroidales bacterium]|nr:PspC domain-containing protein [Bacteroidales bacterium]